MNRFAKMKKERIYTLFETLSKFFHRVIFSKHAKIILSKLVHLIFHVSRKISLIVGSCGIRIREKIY